ncbi:MAG: hypothetical protein RL007_421 [Bacteroidota bacterium]
MPVVDVFAGNATELLRTFLVMAIIAFLCSGFLAVTFLQSAINKIADYKGNREYFKAQFSQTPLRHFTGLLLPFVTILELMSGLLCVIGMIMVPLNAETSWMILGCASGAITIICLLIGQRIAKDYAGAASLTGYFIVAILGLIGTAFCG